MISPIASGRRIAVEILPFVSRVFIDEEAKELNQRLNGRTVRGKEPIPFSFQEFLRDPERTIYTFGVREAEEVVETVLMIGAIYGSPVGVSKEELYRLFEASGGRMLSGQWKIQRLIDAGFFREEMVVDVPVLFPTDKMFLRIIEGRKEYHKKYLKQKEAAK